MNAVRITVALLPRAKESLSRLLKRTGKDQTSLVNSAIGAYDLLEAAHRDGKAIIIRDKNGRESEVRFL